MHPTEYFRDSRCRLPGNPRPAQTGFRTHLGAMFAAYDTLIGDAATSTDPLLQAVVKERAATRALAAEILGALDAHKSGLPAQCFSLLSGALVPVRPILDRLNVRNLTAANPPMFRLRVDDAPALLAAGGLFHIPLDKRHLVASQRYSIPGVPSLYLGNSILVCWNELRRPDLNKVAACAFRVASGESINVINFGWAPDSLAAVMEHSRTPAGDDYMSAYATCWPLIAACSIRTAYDHAAFKVEYVIPQTLLQWVQADGNLDGLAYFSTHGEYTGEPGPMVNWVFPTRAPPSQASGYCARLLSKLEIGLPMAWQTFMVVPRAHGHPANVINGQIQIQQGVRVYYQSTDLFAFQNSLLFQAVAGRPL